MTDPDPARTAAKQQFGHIWHIPGQPVTYVLNPKAATRTIGAALWRAHDGNPPQNIHAADDRPYLPLRQVRDELDAVLATDWFTVARNPYARFASAYLDKVADPRAWRGRVYTRFQQSPDPTPSVADFVSLVEAADPETVDHHFRAQHVNVLHGVAPLGFVGRLEDMSEVWGWLRPRGVLPETGPVHMPTGAAGRVGEVLDDESLRARVARLYARDFEVFGYSEDFRDLSPVAGVDLGAGSGERLREAMALVWPRLRARAKAPAPPGEG